MPIRFCSLIARTAALSASRAIAAFLAITIAPAILAPSVALAQGTLPTGNLVTNPSANNGISGWTNVQGQFSVRTSAPPTNVFWGGTAASSSGHQYIDVSGWAAQIDSGCVTASFDARLGGYEAQPDYAYVYFAFYDATFEFLGNLQIGPVTAAQRGNVTNLLPRSSSGVAVPPGTRRILVAVYSVRFSGTNNDGYADDISVRLFEVPGCCDLKQGVRPDGTGDYAEVWRSTGNYLALPTYAENSSSSVGIVRARWFWRGTLIADQAANGGTLQVPGLFSTTATRVQTSFFGSRLIFDRVHPEAAGRYTVELTGTCGNVRMLTWDVRVWGCDRGTGPAANNPPLYATFDDVITTQPVVSLDQTFAAYMSTVNGARRIGILTGYDGPASVAELIAPPSRPWPMDFQDRLVLRNSTLVTVLADGASTHELLIYSITPAGTSGGQPPQSVPLLTPEIYDIDFDGETIVALVRDSVAPGQRLLAFSRAEDGTFAQSYNEFLPNAITSGSISVHAGRLIYGRVPGTFLSANDLVGIRERVADGWIPANIEWFEFRSWLGSRVDVSIHRDLAIVRNIDVEVLNRRNGVWVQTQRANPINGGAIISGPVTGVRMSDSHVLMTGGGLFSIADGTLSVIDTLRDSPDRSVGSPVGRTKFGIDLVRREAQGSGPSWSALTSTFSQSGGAQSPFLPRLMIDDHAPVFRNSDSPPMPPVPPVLVPGGSLVLSVSPNSDPIWSFWRFRGIAIDSRFSSSQRTLPPPYQNMSVARTTSEINGVLVSDSITILNLDPTATPDDFTYFRSLGCSVGIHYPQLSEGPDAANDTAPGPSIPLPGTFRSVVGTFSNLSPDHFRLVIPPHEGLKVHTIDFSEYFTASDPGAPAIRVELLGLSQANGVIDPNTPVAATTQIRTGVSSGMEDPTVFYTHGPTSPVFVDVRVTPVAPELDGAAYTLTVFSSASQDFSLPTPLRAGQVTISAQSPAPTQDVDMWLYDDQFNPVPFAGNDDVAVLDDRAEFSISLPRGTYHLAVARGDVINNQPAAPGDLQQFGPVFASPNLTAGSDHGSEAPLAQIALTFTTPDGNQTLDVQTSRYIAWVKVQVNPVPPCNPADIADTDAGPGSDGVIDNGDFTLFFVAFFSDSSSPLFSLADIANTDGVLPADGVVDNGDFTRFFVSFFEGCP